MRKQIGWFVLHQDTEFTNTYEFAAWYERGMVKAGRYPIEVSDYKVSRKATSKRRIGKVDGHVGSAYIYMDGVITSDYFAAHYGGMPVSDYDTKQNAGKESTFSMHPYLYSIADDVINGNDVKLGWGEDAPTGHYELYPEYAAKKVYSKVYWSKDEEEKRKWVCTHGIFLKPEYR